MVPDIGEFFYTLNYYFHYHRYMKYFVFSIDDGTVFDRDTIELFNRYNVRCTFNLNSGLDNYTWYYEDRIPITRLILQDNIHLYDNHEVASHTLTHPYLDSCSDEEVARQINEDISNLERIFNREIVSFATPFQTCGDREVELIRNNTKIQNIRLSMLDESFQYPSDKYHFKITTFDIDRALYLIEEFIKDDNAKLFIYAGHSYDFYVNNSFYKLEELLKIITSNEDIKVITMKELMNLI